MFSKLFDVFSRRDKEASVSSSNALTREFRNRVLMLLRDGVQHDFNEFLRALHQKATYLYGEYSLSDPSLKRSPDVDMFSFLIDCKDEQFLDMIELIFRSNLPGVSWPDNSLIPGINEFFVVDDLPFYLTGYTMEECQSTLYGEPRNAMRIADYPKVIRKESEVLHQSAIKPALKLLQRSEFKHANDEFQKALEDHRKGDYRDCLTKCGSAFESVMKVICSHNSLIFDETDSASTLLKMLIAKSNLDQYWEQPLIMIATLRNRLSSSHGAGTKAKIIPVHVATYAINATASAILLLRDEFA